MILFTLILSQLAFATAYDGGNIPYSQKEKGGKYTVEFTPKQPLSHTELDALMFVHMAKVCGKKFLYLDMFQHQPESPASAPVKTATIQFHCEATPSFFGGKKEAQKQDISEMCAKADSAYLQKLCAELK